MRERFPRAGTRHTHIHTLNSFGDAANSIERPDQNIEFNCMRVSVIPGILGII